MTDFKLERLLLGRISIERMASWLYMHTNKRLCLRF